MGGNVPIQHHLAAAQVLGGAPAPHEDEVVCERGAHAAPANGLEGGDVLGDEDERGDPEREFDGVGAEGPERGVHRCGG